MEQLGLHSIYTHSRTIDGSPELLPQVWCSPAPGPAAPVATSGTATGKRDPTYALSRGQTCKGGGCLQVTLLAPDHHVKTWGVQALHP